MLLLLLLLLLFLFVFPKLDGESYSQRYIRPNHVWHSYKNAHTILMLTVLFQEPAFCFALNFHFLHSSLLQCYNEFKIFKVLIYCVFFFFIIIIIIFSFLHKKSILKTASISLLKMLKISSGQKAVSYPALHMNLFRYIVPFCKGLTHLLLEINNIARSL